MSNRFVRSSKFRHVYGTSSKRDLCYENIRVSRNAWDTNVVKVNPLFVACNWDASGGGKYQFPFSYWVRMSVLCHVTNHL